MLLIIQQRQERGAQGTSFSGGSGGSGCANMANNFNGYTGNHASPFGGAGGGEFDSSNYYGGHGAGNPWGGTGGLLVIYANKIAQSGNIEANGSDGFGRKNSLYSWTPMSYGGASGGRKY